MISRLQAHLLNVLINKYEVRKDFGQSEKSKRRTMLHMNERNFPDYFHVSDSSYRREFNLDAEALAAQGLIHIYWERFNEKEVIDKLILLEDDLQKIYDLLGRTPKQEKYKRIHHIITDYHGSAPKVLQSFYTDLLSRLSGFAPLPSIINLDSESETEDALRGLHYLLNNQEEIPKRIWSIMLYHDSKRWEKLEKRIIKVVRDYVQVAASEYLDDSQLLAEYGILNNPQLIHMSGNVVLRKGLNAINFSLFTPEFGVNPSFFDICYIESINADRVITIENLTSYHDYLYYKNKYNHNSIVLYLGGYHNYGRRMILNKMNEFLEEHQITIPFYHWGDIDLHGFHIWKHLKNKTGIDFKPLYMDGSTYLNHVKNGKPINSTDLTQLKKLLSQDEYKNFHEVIHLMLEHKRAIEQESIHFINTSYCGLVTNDGEYGSTN